MAGTSPAMTVESHSATEGETLLELVPLDWHVAVVGSGASVAEFQFR
jgi:hypothetical protein